MYRDHAISFFDVSNSVSFSVYQTYSNGKTFFKNKIVRANGSGQIKQIDNHMKIKTFSAIFICWRPHLFLNFATEKLQFCFFVKQKFQCHNINYSAVSFNAFWSKMAQINFKLTILFIISIEFSSISNHFESKSYFIFFERKYWILNFSPFLCEFCANPNSISFESVESSNKFSLSLSINQTAKEHLNKFKIRWINVHASEKFAERNSWKNAWKFENRNISDSKSNFKSKWFYTDSNLMVMQDIPKKPFDWMLIRTEFVQQFLDLKCNLRLIFDSLVPFFYFYDFPIKIDNDCFKANAWECPQYWVSFHLQSLCCLIENILIKNNLISLTLRFNFSLQEIQLKKKL